MELGGSAQHIGNGIQLRITMLRITRCQWVVIRVVDIGDGRLSQGIRTS